MKELPSFEDMVKMAQENPDALENLRQEMCEEVIQSAPETSQRKLRGLQFKIDMERRRAKTPMASCIRLSQMMHESFADLREALNDMQGTPTKTLRTLVRDPVLASEKAAHDANANAADVIDFPAN
jgi:predicted chitinase